MTSWGQVYISRAHHVTPIFLNEVHLVHQTKYNGIWRMHENGLQTRLVVVNVLVEFRADGIEYVDQNVDIFEDQVSVRRQVVIEWIVLTTRAVSFSNANTQHGQQTLRNPIDSNVSFLETAHWSCCPTRLEQSVVKNHQHELLYLTCRLEISRLFGYIVVKNNGSHRRFSCTASAH